MTPLAVVILVVAPAAAWLGFVALLWWQQDRMIFPGWGLGAVQASGIGPGAERLELVTPDGVRLVGAALAGEDLAGAHENPGAHVDRLDGGRHGHRPEAAIRGARRGSGASLQCSVAPPWRRISMSFSRTTSTLSSFGARERKRSRSA